MCRASLFLAEAGCCSAVHPLHRSLEKFRFQFLILKECAELFRPRHFGSTFDFRDLQGACRRHISGCLKLGYGSVARYCWR